jgi:hypothetical protein
MSLWTLHGLCPRHAQRYFRILAVFPALLPIRNGHTTSAFQVQPKLSKHVHICRCHSPESAPYLGSTLKQDVHCVCESTLADDHIFGRKEIQCHNANQLDDEGMWPSAQHRDTWDDLPEEMQNAFTSAPLSYCLFSVRCISSIIHLHVVPEGIRKSIQDGCFMPIPHMQKRISIIVPHADSQT